MINFRYHVVSLAAVLLALAAGVVLGAGFLDGADDDAGSTTVADQGVASFDAGYASRTAPALLDDQLAGNGIVLFTTPGVRAADVRGVEAALQSAGGEVLGQIELTTKLLEPGGRQFADGVVERAGAEIEAVSGADAGYPRIGAALARAYLTTDQTDVDEAANQLRTAFLEGDLVTNAAEPDTRGTLAVVITGPRSSSTEPQGASLAALTTTLGQGSDGIVVAGPSTSSLDGGLLSTVRATETAASVSTVDVADLPAGRIVVALALARAVDDQAGAWGTSRSADGSVPE